MSNHKQLHHFSNKKLTIMENNIVPTHGILSFFATFVGKFSSIFQKETVVERDKQAISNMLLIEGVAVAKKIKTAHDRWHTRKTYINISNQIIKFISERDLGEMLLKDFTKRYALELMDWHGSRTIEGVTYNNYIAHYRAFFTELVDRELIAINPFVGIKDRRVGEKVRRAFTDEERKICIDAIREKDYFLFLMVCFGFYTLLRWSELKRLRFKDFDLVRGVINLSADKTKNYKAAIVTIPPAFLTVLRQPEFTQYPANYLLFGVMAKPHPTKNCGENTLRSRHKKIMESLKEQNLLTNIEGLTPYSWKDTGITCLIEKVGAQATKNHARHATEEQTNTYVQKKEINEFVKNAGLNIAG